MRHLDFVLSPLDQFEVRDLFLCLDNKYALTFVFVTLTLSIRNNYVKLISGENLLSSTKYV